MFSRHYVAYKSLLTARQPFTFYRFVIIAGFFLFLAILVWSFQSVSSPKEFSKHKASSPPKEITKPSFAPGLPQGSGQHVGKPSVSALKTWEQTWKKPQDLKVIGLVFYGRREFVEVLDCYLRRNLVINGGILDEIVFAVKTSNDQDLAFLDRLVNSTEGYTKHKARGQYDNFIGSFEIVERGNIYIKIDGSSQFPYHF
jgi:hypothetical protein